MHASFTREQQDFVDTVRTFLKREVGVDRPLRSETVFDRDRAFSRKLADRGWIGLAWPRPFDGVENGHVARTLLMEELVKGRAPIGYHFLAEQWAGPSLIRCGTDWQRSHFLPGIRHSEKGMMFCLLRNEPNVGADAARMTTTATKKGDHYLINGKKVTTAGADHADFGWLLARSDPDPSVSPDRACSEFILDLTTPGVTVRPVMDDDPCLCYCEVTLDQVTVHEKYMVGVENQGFGQMQRQRDQDRSGIHRLMRNYPLYNQLVTYVQWVQNNYRASGYCEWTKEALARLEIAYKSTRLLCYHAAWLMDRGGDATGPAAMCKIRCLQFDQKLTDTATRILGPTSLNIAKDPGQWSPLEAGVASLCLRHFGGDNGGESIERLRSIVAQNEKKLRG